MPEPEKKPAATTRKAPPRTAAAKPPEPPAAPDYLTKDQIDWLLKGIEPYRVQHKGGKSNLQAYDVRNHLNEVFGFANWDGEVIAMDLVFDVQKTLKDNKPGAYVCYRATYRLTIRALSGKQLAVYTEVAAGDGQMPANMRFEAHDFAMKTAESQALKRAAINLGNQFGLSLYAKGNTGGITRGTFHYPTPSTLAPLTEQITEETDPDATHEAEAAHAAAEASQAPQPPAPAPVAPAPTPAPAVALAPPPPVQQQAKEEETIDGRPLTLIADIADLQESLGWLSNEARAELMARWKKTTLPPLVKISNQEQLAVAWQLYEQVKPPTAQQPAAAPAPEPHPAVVPDAQLQANVDASWGLTQQRQAQVDQARRHFGVTGDTPHPYSEDFPPADDNEPYSS